MKQTRAVALATALLAFAFHGCADERTPAEQLAHDLASAACDVYFDCAVTDSDGATWRVLAGSRDACVRELEGEFRDPTRDAAIDAGTVTIDEAARSECVRNMRTLCTLDPWPCDEVLVGTVPAGGACRSSAECGDDGFCTGSAEACGQCLTPTVGTVALHGTCLESSDCAPSDEGEVWCAPGIPPTCELVAAARVGAPGEACGEGAGPNDEDVSCGPGYYCGFGGVSFTCRAELAVGESCIPDLDACVPDAACITNELGVGECRAIVVRTKQGEPCDEVAELCSYRHNLLCDSVSESCVLLGTGREGDDCFVDSNCNDGLYCQYASEAARFGTCARLLADGADCDTSRECRSGYCSWSGAVCLDPAAMPACE